MENKIEEIKSYIKNNLSQFRYEHSIRVAETARSLAKHYKINAEKAYIAGIVHDIAREFSIEENKKWVEKYNLPKELLAPKFKDIIHADIGAVVVKELFGFDDEICNAVKYHTIGNVSMSFFDKVIFVADIIGRKNTNSEIDKIRELAYQDIDKAVKQCLINQKYMLESNGKIFHPNALDLLNSL